MLRLRMQLLLLSRQLLLQVLHFTAVQLLLLRGVNPDVRARGGLTSLHIAVSKCQVGCVRALIENGADITVRDDLGQDAIAKAELRSKKREAVLKLLRSKGK